MSQHDQPLHGHRYRWDIYRRRNRADDGTMNVWKLPSTPAAPEQAVIAGSGALNRVGGTPQDLTRFPRQYRSSQRNDHP